MGIDAEMFVRIRADVTEADLVQASWLLCSVFGHGHFMVSPKNGRRALSIEPTHEQDGPTIRPKKGETFIRVNLWSRYWGPGYERGDLALLLAVAAWLEKRFPGGEVWYGGDSSGVCAEKFDAEAREAYIEHAASKLGAEYRVGHGTSQTCDFCQAPMAECRWGGGSTGSSCHGCGLHRLVHDSGSVTEAYGKWPDDRMRDAG